MNGRPRTPPLKLVPSQSNSATNSGRVSIDTSKHHHLQLVVASTNTSTSGEGSRTAPQKPEQLSLFSEGERVLLGIVNVDRIRGSRFVAILRDIRPKWLIDLRVVPHFSIDQLNRRYVFSIFEECRIEYLDMMTELDIRSRKDASLSSGRVAQEIMRIWAALGTDSVLGSIIFLVDDDEIAKVSATVFPEKLEPRPKAGWDTRFLN